MIFTAGQTARLTVSFYADGVKVVSPGTVALTLVLPDASTLTPAVTDEGQGLFSAEMTVTQVGLYRWRWTATAPVASADEGQFSVSSYFTA